MSGVVEAVGMTYTAVVFYSPDSGVYVADIPALGIATQGDTLDHAYEMAREAVELWLEDAIANGDEIPVDRDLNVRQITVSV
jgi:predicted RNase H-like HicB family nuclease